VFLRELQFVKSFPHFLDFLYQLFFGLMRVFHFFEICGGINLHLLPFLKSNLYGKSSALGEHRTNNNSEGAPLQSEFY